jgi:hypothetical protein
MAVQWAMNNYNFNNLFMLRGYIIQYEAQNSIGIQQYHILCFLLFYDFLCSNGFRPG